VTDAHDTISGFVSGKAGRVPQGGEVLADGDVHFVVEESNDQHVNRVRVIVPEPQEADE
jgi:CBS domain containing-hemolysin-like protein